MSVIAGVSYAALATREKLRGGIGKAEVRRYWPGQAPAWAGKAEEDDGLNVLGRVFRKPVDHRADLEVSRKDDPRLRRLSENREQFRADRRRVREAEIISTEEEEEGEELRKQESAKEVGGEEEDGDAIAERRRRIKEKIERAQQEEDDLLPKEEEVQDEEEEEEEDESEYEYETDSDTSHKARFKPLFVPKAERDTVVERERLEAEEEALVELAKKKLEMRKIETKQIVVAEVRKDEERRVNKALEEEAGIGDVDTDDEMDEAEEYERWTKREIARIKTEKDERKAMSVESEEVDKLRKMTEKERRVWESEHPEACRKAVSAKRKTKRKFMQKYYHKGAFYQEDGILARDFSAPTGEDKLDKSDLPDLLKVKKFGHSGRTKWTHLVKEDTTNCDPWSSQDPRLEEYKKAMSSM